MKPSALNGEDESKKHDTLIINYLNKNNVPYNSGTCFRYIETSLDYVIPGAIIKIKVGKFSSERAQSTEKCIDQLEKLRLIVPESIKIYLYLPNVENKSFFEHINCTIIDCIEDIKAEPSVYYANKPYNIKSLVSSMNDNYDNDLIKYTNNIYTTEFIYNRCLPILLDDELEKLKKFNFKFGSEDEVLKNNSYVCYINKLKIPHLNKQASDILDLQTTIPLEYFTFFRTNIKGIGLSIDKRVPVRNIPETTFICGDCSAIYYMEYESKTTANCCKYCK